MFFAQHRDSSKDGGGREAEEQVNKRERTSHNADVSEQSTPSIIDHGKTEGRQNEGKASLKIGPPKRTKKK